MKELTEYQKKGIKGYKAGRFVLTFPPDQAKDIVNEIEILCMHINNRSSGYSDNKYSSARKNLLDLLTGKAYCHECIPDTEHRRLREWATCNENEIGYELPCSYKECAKAVLLFENDPKKYKKFPKPSTSW